MGKQLCIPGLILYCNFRFSHSHAQGVIDERLCEKMPQGVTQDHVVQNQARKIRQHLREDYGEQASTAVEQVCYLVDGLIFAWR